MFLRMKAERPYRYDTVGQLIAAYNSRKAKGIHPYWSVNHGLTMSMYYVRRKNDKNKDRIRPNVIDTFLSLPISQTDPDGNVVEFQVDAFPTADEAHHCKLPLLPRSIFAT